MKKLVLLTLILLFVVTFVFASTPEELQEEAVRDEFLQEILLSDIPVTYGDESFRARILARTEGKRDPIGLVLTGGSARACAHIGVLRYLDDMGIQPDFIISNSMGSIIGMLYAYGLSPDQIEELMLAGDISSYFSLTLPRAGGFLSTAGFRTLVESVVGRGTRIEDTEIPIMVVCDDLVSKREVRIAEGDFASILIGSFALPTYFEPFEYNGHMLIDGGTISLAPLAVAYDYSDTVILSTTFYDVPTMELLNPVTILNVSFDIGKRQNASYELREFYDKMIWVRCGVESFSFMAFDKCSEMADIGYDSAKKEAKAIDKLYRYEATVDEEKQARLDERINRVRDNLRFFGRITATKPATTLTFDFYGLDSYNTNYFLKNSFNAGLELKTIVNFFEFSLFAGTGWDAQNLAHTDSFLTAGASASYYPTSNVRLKVEGYADFLREGAEFAPLLYVRQAGDMYVKENDRHQVKLHEVAEYSHDTSEVLGKGLLAGLYMDGSSDFDDFSLTYDVGALFTNTELSLEDFQEYLQVSATLDVAVIGKTRFAVSTRYRKSIDKDDNVPVFLSDRFVTSTIGYGASVLDTPYTNYVLVTNASLYFQSDKTPTFGEFLILNNPGANLFFSSLVSDEGFAYTIGAGVDMTASLIGLVKLPLSFKVGFENRMDGTKGVAASLFFSSSK